MMKANKKVMAALLAAMMTVSAGAAVVSAGNVSQPGDPFGDSSSVNNGWNGITIKDTNDKKGDVYYYQTGNKTYATGWKLIDGDWYYLVPKTSQDFQFGKTAYNHHDNYTNTESKEIGYALRDGVYTLTYADHNNKPYTFRFDKQGKMVKGWYDATKAQTDPTQVVGNGWEFYDYNTGAQTQGWIKDGANWFYITKPGDKANGVVVDSENKVVEDNTLLMNGTYTINKIKYTFAANGVLVNQGQGWFKDGDTWYYMESGKRFMGTELAGFLSADSWKLINGKYYLFNTKGEMLTGWNYVRDADKNPHWYYCTSNGDLVMNNWVKTNNDWYLTNPSGEMLTGWQSKNGKVYYLRPDGARAGAMVTGTLNISGAQCVFDASGALVSINGNAAEGDKVPNL